VLIPSKWSHGRADTITQDLSCSTRQESLQILNMAPKAILISLLCILYENLEEMSPIDFTEKATTLMQKLLDVTKDVFCEVAFQTLSELSVIYFFPTYRRFSKKSVQLFYFFCLFLVVSEVGDTVQRQYAAFNNEKKKKQIMASFPKTLIPVFIGLILWLSLQSHKVVTLFGNLF
jgi:uncharacterized membrane protein YqjE